MRYKPGHKEDAHPLMVAAVGRGFRRKGFGGIGVDGLAKEADVTSGAFYGHFASKEAAFIEAIIEGVDEVRRTVEQLRLDSPGNWAVTFIDTYLGPRRTCDMAESCAIQSLSAEVARAGNGVRKAYEREMLRVVRAVAEGLPGDDPDGREARAWALLSLLSGTVTLCRALEDQQLSSIVASSARSAALQIALGN